MSSEFIGAAKQLIVLLRRYFKLSGVPPTQPEYQYEVTKDKCEERIENHDDYDFGQFRSLLNDNDLVSELLREVKPLREVADAITVINQLNGPDVSPRFTFLFGQFVNMSWLQSIGSCHAWFGQDLKTERYFLTFTFRPIDVDFLDDMDNSLEEKLYEQSDFSDAKSPAEWERIFGLTWKTIKKRIDYGAVRVIKHSSKSYQIHNEDVPSGTN